ncbi:hypothetical protein [Novipirellula artificiosorum]|uniref:Uncharacterized protein n=1 Tax=Novipirellula artificiosorum TaxID=2528016 RepID=A0A5C6DCM5_9BACT|nr:hypothetical protein [Novipirellula artificiosorum]TWU34520.1 hypothetical protein Poly41_46700 [Novipirellula artificiosorum]
MKRIAVLIDPELPSETRAVVRRAAESAASLQVARFDCLERSPNRVGVSMLPLWYDVLLTTGGYDDAATTFPARRRPHFSVDPLTNPLAQWGWFQGMDAIRPWAESDQRENHERLRRCFDQIKADPLSKAYVFGTGPSLDLAYSHDFSDGYRVVCNTICKDPELFSHLRPDVIVAGDALYHFGDSGHAVAFRNDLHDRMKEGTTVFLYPDLFRFRIQAEFADVADRCVALPTGQGIDFTRDIAETYEFAATGNVLGQMLVPVACSLAKQVHLLGFDGRKPNDKHFWANSARVSYPGMIETMRGEYPAFYDHHVPASNPLKYVNAVQGDALSEAFDHAEGAGWQFALLSPSTSPALANRRLIPIAESR